MIVTNIEPVAKTRYRVYLDEEFAFVLYKGELSRYGIRVGEELPDPIRERIHTEVLVKRAKLRAMHLLNDMDRTEWQITEKLKSGGYTDDVIAEALSYVKSFGYIDDAAYARRFVDSRKETKSRKEIYALLCKRGVPGDVMDAAMEECYEEEDARETICHLLSKKRYDPQAASEDDKRRMIAYLARKGFRYEDIRQVIQVS